MVDRVSVKIGEHIAAIISHKEAESWINTGQWKWEDEDENILIMKKNSG